MRRVSCLNTHVHACLIAHAQVPFTMATSTGLAARAMNLPVSIAESNAGLVPPAVIQELMGAGGGFLLMLQLCVYDPGLPDCCGCWHACLL